MAQNTKQYDRIITGRRTRIITAAVILGVCVASIVAGVVYHNTRPYEAPPFDETAIEGVPTPPEDLGFGYGGAGTEGGFKVGIVSKWIRAADGCLPVWFTNPPENEANLMLRICRVSDNKIIYQSGIVRPGEYVEKLMPLIDLPEEPIDVQVAIYSFDEDYHSLGTLQLSGTVE